MASTAFAYNMVLYWLPPDPQGFRTPANRDAAILLFFLYLVAGAILLKPGHVFEKLPFAAKLRGVIGFWVASCALAMVYFAPAAPGEEALGMLIAIVPTFSAPLLVLLYLLFRLREWWTT